jgi:hypothetical protein
MLAFKVAGVHCIPVTCRGTTELIVPLIYVDQFAVKLREAGIKYKSRNGALVEV